MRVSPPVIIALSRGYGINVPPEARRWMSPSVHREGSSVTDAELVARLKANDERAYREVVARFGDPLYGYIYSITGDHHLSEDILSETYLRMVEKIDSYTFYGAPFKAWLYRIAHNLAINTLKRAQRLVGADALETAVPPVDDPATTIAVRLEADELRTALAELTEEQ